MASKKLSELPVANTIAKTDRIVILSNPGSTPVAKTIALDNLTVSRLSNSAPANSTSLGVQGNIAYDANYIYICISGNTWVRAALTSF